MYKSIFNLHNHILIRCFDNASIAINRIKQSRKFLDILKGACGHYLHIFCGNRSFNACLQFLMKHLAALVLRSHHRNFDVVHCAILIILGAVSIVFSLCLFLLFLSRIFSALSACVAAIFCFFMRKKLFTAHLTNVWKLV